MGNEIDPVQPHRPMMLLAGERFNHIGAGRATVQELWIPAHQSKDDIPL